MSTSIEGQDVDTIKHESLNHAGAAQERGQEGIVGALGYHPSLKLA